MQYQTLPNDQQGNVKELEGRIADKTNFGQIV